MRILFLIFQAVLAFHVTAIDVAQPAGPTNIVSQVVVRGEGFMVQALRFPLADLQRSLAREEMTQRGPALLHTVLPKGDGRVLVRTQTTREWRTRVGGYWHSRIVGLTADAERLYVAVWHAGGRGRAPFFLLPDKLRPKYPHRINARLEVRVFALADGKHLHTAKVPGLPAGVLQETFSQPGPLKKVKGGVDCFGTRLRFDGTKLRRGDAKP